jgi:hypothetical protein
MSAGSLFHFVGPGTTVANSLRNSSSSFRYRLFAEKSGAASFAISSLHLYSDRAEYRESLAAVSTESPMI